ncbi:MAG TPA: M3 family metallopeptidase, partial [Sphingomicrobium sp.]|nr:M3 family metallopeptidase [Sphingomicrobium sp.]
LVNQTNLNEPVRAEAESCVSRASDALTGVTLSRPIYDRLAAIPAGGLDEQSRFTLDKTLTNFRLSGVDRDPATRDKVAALQKEITDIGLKFDANIRDDKGNLALKPSELEGVPQDWLDAHKPKDDGLVHITRDYPDVFPLLDFAKSRETRRKVSIFFRNRGYPANEPVLQLLLQKRYELAKLLGYPNYAAYTTVDKMIGTPERAAAFIEEMKAASDSATEADKAELLSVAKGIDPSIERLESWDNSYFSNLLRKQKYNVDSAEVRQYFTYDKARAGIFAMMRDLFGADIRPWKTEVWAPDVTAWELYDQGKLIGRFYLDMHPRQGKYGHAAAFFVRTGVAGQQVPTSALVTNFPATGPMDHGDVETFLHEFGHLIHQLYSGRVTYASQAMFNLQWDFIEAPSQLLEEWIWDYDTLKSFASNAKGAPIPAALVERMNAGRKFGEAIGTRGQLAYAAVSLGYYNRAPGFDLKQVFDSEVSKYSPFPVVPEAHQYAGFDHLNGYSAVYYTYVWSKAIALDLFTRFKEAGIRNPEVAMKYRTLVLEPGGSKDANKLIEEFLGRPLSLAAYKERLQQGHTVGAD